MHLSSSSRIYTTAREEIKIFDEYLVKSREKSHQNLNLLELKNEKLFSLDSCSVHRLRMCESSKLLSTTLEHSEMYENFPYIVLYIVLLLAHGTALYAECEIKSEKNLRFGAFSIFAIKTRKIIVFKWTR